VVVTVAVLAAVVTVLGASVDSMVSVADGTQAPSTLDLGVPVSSVIPSHVAPSSHTMGISFRTAASRSSDIAISSALVLAFMPPVRAGLGCLRDSVGTESGYAAGHISEDARRGPAEHTARCAEEGGRRCPRYVR